jgi:dienelactone hydrolase
LYYQTSVKPATIAAASGRPRARAILAGGMVLLAALATACSTATPSDDPREDSWLAGELAVPDSASADPRCAGKTLVVGGKRGIECARAISGPRPLVIFLHGCAGPNQAHHIEMFRRLGYVVVAPDSRASGREMTCPTRMQSVIVRHREIDDALKRTQAWPWVDRAKIVLAGQSEGGIAAALYERQDVLRARIIMGWSCNSNSMSYHGLKGREPTLSFVFNRDPWHIPHNPGDCGTFMKPPSKSVVFPGAQHDVVAFHEDIVSKEVGAFLNAVLVDPR